MTCNASLQIHLQETFRARYYTSFACVEVESAIQTTNFPQPEGKLYETRKSENKNNYGIAFPLHYCFLHVSRLAQDVFKILSILVHDVFNTFAFFMNLFMTFQDSFRTCSGRAQ